MTRLGISIISMVSALFFAVSAQGQVAFFGPPEYAGTGPVFVADFNGDGIPDILTGGGTLQFGTGNGTFTSGPPVTGGAIAVADFNNDGKPDVLQQGSGTLLVLLNNGNGTFQSPITTVTGVTLSSVVVGNLGTNADVVGISNNNLMVFLGNGNGTFATPGTSYSLPLPSGASATSIVLGDFTGNGNLDVAVITAGSSTAPVIVYLGNGNGTLQTPPKSSTGVLCATTAVEGDFNNDGNLDLVVGGSGCAATELLLGNGNGTFQAPTAIFSAVGRLAVGDFTGNGNLDLVVDNGYPPLPQIYLGSGNGTFTYAAAYFPGVVQMPQGVAPAIADFTLNGKLDIAADNVMLLGNGNGTFQGIPAGPVPPLANSTGPSALAIGDFDNNGTEDVAVISTDSATNTSNVYILTNNGSGLLTLVNTYALSQSAYQIATADLTGNGNLDLVVTGQDPTTQDWSYFVLLGNGNGSFQSPVLYQQAVAARPSALLIANFNNSGSPDLAVALPSSTDLALLIGNGNGTFGSPAYIFDGEGASSLVAADFNGDGNLDIAAGGTVGTGLLFGNGNGTFQNVVFPTNLLNFVVTATADFNNDGKPDLLSDGVVALGNGNGTFTVLPTFLPSVAGESFTAGPPIADFNGDGDLDVSGTEQLGSSVYDGLFLGNGNGTFGSFGSVVFAGDNFASSGLTALAAVDMNGDGRPDLVLAEESLFPAIVVLLNTTPPNFVVSASALSPATVTAGSPATSTVTLVPTFGFNSTVTLSCSGLPSGASCGFSPVSIANSSGTSNLTVTTSSNTAAGTYSVKVQGTSGSLVNSATLTLVVQAAPNFGIGPASGQATSETISAGQSANFSLMVTPAGSFTGTVNLSCSIKPAVTPAATCSLSGSSVKITGSSGQPVTVTVGTAAATATGTISDVDFPARWLAMAWMGGLFVSGWLWLRNRKRLPALAAPVIVLAMACWGGCGGGSSSSSQTTGTPSGTYTATITGTSSSLSNNTSVTVVVQ